MTDRLIVLADRRMMGTLVRAPAGRLTFTYDDTWRDAPDAYPLSLGMPMIVAEHGQGRIDPWLWGLLPDNEYVLRRWAQQFQVSPRNVFALLSHVGEDCAGAIQFVNPDRVTHLIDRAGGHVEWLNEDDIGSRLALLRRDQAGWRMASDTGQFCLAGVQPKTALLFDGRRWGVPAGSIPTTHILKPPPNGESLESGNEYVCLRLARAFGLPAADTDVRWFAGEPAIVVERYDRVDASNTIRRVHQEDFCQLGGLPPTQKYQNEGGPSAQDIVEAIRTHSARPRDDALTFIRALIFNWLIGGTDGHAKNYSLLIGANARARLAPLYDIASAYLTDMDPRRLRLAQKIGDRYRISEIARHRWERFAAGVRMRPDEVVDACQTMAEDLPVALAGVLQPIPEGALSVSARRHIEARLNARAAEARRAMA